jgi:prevent-host-death family protein
MAITMSWSRVKKDSKTALRRAESTTVFITNKGIPAHVLISVQEYQRLVAGRRDAEGG